MEGSVRRRRKQLQPDEYPHRPVCARAGPEMLGRSMENVECIPINPKKPVPFETELFKGEVCLCIRGTPNAETDPWAEGERFFGKRRKVVLTIKGKFKKRLRQDQVFCGLVWRRQLVNLPWTFVLNAAENLIVALSPGAKSSLAAKENPHFLNYLLAGSDTIHVNNGDTPSFDITSKIVPEHAGFDTPKKRMDAVKQASRQSAHQWDHWEVGPEYTFDFYGDKVDLVRFVALIPTLPEFQLQKYFNGQPFPFIAKTDTGEVLWQFEIWNEALFQTFSEGDWAGLGDTVRGDDVSETSSACGFAGAASGGDASRHHSFITCGASSIGDTDRDSQRISMSSIPSLRPIAPLPTRGQQRRIPRVNAQRWRKRLQIDKQRWAAWDEHLGGPNQPRPSDSLCAAAVAVTALVLLGFVGFWWYDLLYDRLTKAMSTVPSGQDWGISVAVLMAVLLVGGLVGQVTGFLKPPGGRKIGRQELIQFMVAVVASIPQEAAFRAVIIPYHHGMGDESTADGKSTVMWVALSVVCFTAHFPVLATTCFVNWGYPTFLDPRFLCLAVVVGVGCSSVYIITGSLWVCVLLNATAWTTWLLFAGGARRLRKVRIMVPNHASYAALSPTSSSPMSPELYTPLHTPLVGTPRGPTPLGQRHYDDEEDEDEDDIATAQSVGEDTLQREDNLV